MADNQSLCRGPVLFLKNHLAEDLRKLQASFGINLLLWPLDKIVSCSAKRPEAKKTDPPTAAAALLSGCCSSGQLPGGIL